jgi:hypothetical protein
MEGNIEQHVCIKFCVKFVKSTTKAFGEHPLSWTAVFEWHSRFKAGRVSFEVDECPGQPSTSKMTENFEKIRELIHEDHLQTIHELADTIGISYVVCKEILTS